MNKKHFIYIFLIGIFIASCEPEVIEKKELGKAPDSTQLSFTIEQGEDAFHYVITNTSSINGIANWDFGNGSKATGDSATVYYPLAGTYTVTLSLYTETGSASVSKELEQTETDFSIFDDPKFTNISGGADDLDGKTWVIDSLSKGHYGVGPADGVGTEWWSADPLAKSGAHSYDDELTFLLTDFVVKYENNGKSFVKDFRVDDSNYSNPVAGPGGDDFVVDYTPKDGTWMIQTIDEVDYLSLNGSTPLFPTFDTGGDRMYKIIELTENRLEISTIGGDESRWHYILIPKGYVPPTITYTLNHSEGTDNEFTFSLSDVDIPEGESINEVQWDFGDGSDVYTTSDYTEQVNHTYMRKGTYPVVVTLKTSLGDLVENLSLDVANNNSAYEEFLLDAMVMYNDFGETALQPVQADAAGGTASIEIVENPDKSMYPNRSSNCAFFSKENTQWANAYLQLPTGYRFDLEDRHTFKFMVYGAANDTILFKLENTDLGGDAWKTGTHDFKYIIKESNTWEIATFDMAGIGAGFDWTGEIFTSDVTTDPNFNHGYYNVLRIMIQPGNANGEYSFYFDSLAGPHMEGLK